MHMNIEIYERFSVFEKVREYSVETDGRDEMSPKMLNDLMKMGLV